ncbi:MAG: hypothetical protein AB1758_19750 [Candidatus Eremiobacterota bacterium]
MTRLLTWLLILLAAGSLGLGGKVPPGWKKLGGQEGLLGDDWYTKRTTHTVSFAREGDLAYVDEVVKGLEESYRVNRDFLGFAPSGTLEFYFFPMTEPAHTHPRFQARLAGRTRAAGVALGGTNTCVVNLGSQRHSQPYAPWEVAETTRHEMNHLFVYQVRSGDRLNSWGWLFEALAEFVENTVKPPSARLDLASVKTFLKGYQAVDANWQALLRERDADDQEQYRDYEKLLSSIIFFMQAKYGKDAIPRLMSNVRGRDLEDALQATFGQGAAGLEKEWKAFYGIK